jgi:hypothetical protein
MLKKIHTNNSLGIELENRIESGDFKPVRLQDSELREMEEKARRILAAEREQA